MARAIIFAPSGQSRQTVQSYITCLSYLHMEAKREGLPEIAAVMRTGLSLIEAWLSNPSSSLKPYELLDSGFCHSLEFLLAVMKLSPKKRKELLDELMHLEEYEDQTEKNTRQRHTKKNLAN